MQHARNPRLDTIKMVEEHIRRHDGEYRKRKLWETLPKQMMYQTYCTTIEYLYESHKISIDSEGKIGWVYYPEKTRQLLRTTVAWDKSKTFRQGQDKQRHRGRRG